MRYFEAVLVRLMFLIAAECVGDRARDKSENRKQQKQDGQRCQVVDVAYAPARAVAPQQTSDGAISQIEENQAADRSEGQTFRNVAEYVVAHLVAGDVNDLRRVHLRNCGVPDD